MTDREIYEQVRTETLAGAGGSLAVHAIVSALDVLYTRFCEEFTIDGAIFELQSIERIAFLFANELRKIKDANHV